MANEQKTERGEVPDGGWGWLIVAGYSVSQLIGVGFNRSFSLIYQQLILRYGQSAAATSSVLSIYSCTKYASSPVVAMWCNKYGQRTVGILAGIIACISMVISAFAPNLMVLYFVFGIVSDLFILAVSRSMEVVSGITMIGQYFRRKRATANSLALMSNCIGGVVMAPVIQLLIHHYGYSGCMMIVGALMLNFCVSAALYRPLTKTSKIKTNTQMEDQETAENSEIKRVGTNENEEETLVDDIDNSVHDTSLEPDHRQSRPRERKKNIFKRACHACSSNFDLPLLKNIPFVAFASLNCTLIMMNVINGSFQASLADDKGFSVSQITFTIMITNLTGVPVRAITGLIMDREFLRHRRVTVIGWMVFVVGVLTFCLPLVPGVAGTIVVWCLYEGVIGACECQQPTITADIVGPDRLTSAVGLIRLFAGFSSLTGPLIGGLLRDITGKYAYAYFAGGIIVMAFATVYLMYRYGNLICHCRKSQVNKQ